MRRLLQAFSIVVRYGKRDGSVAVRGPLILYRNPGQGPISIYAQPLPSHGLGLGLEVEVEVEVEPDSPFENQRLDKPAACPSPPSSHKYKSPPTTIYLFRKICFDETSPGAACLLVGRVVLKWVLGDSLLDSGVA